MLDRPDGLDLGANLLLKIGWHNRVNRDLPFGDEPRQMRIDGVNRQSAFGGDLLRREAARQHLPAERDRAPGFLLRL